MEYEHFWVLLGHIEASHGRDAAKIIADCSRIATGLYNEKGRMQWLAKQSLLMLVAQHYLS